MRNQPNKTALLFIAPWCKGCDVVDKILFKEYTDNHDKFNYKKVRCDEDRETPVRYQVQGLPTVLLLNGKTPQASICGNREEIEYQTAIKRWLMGI